jgi:hypothetical protein
MQSSALSDGGRPGPNEMQLTESRRFLNSRRASRLPVKRVSEYSVRNSPGGFGKVKVGRKVPYSGEDGTLAALGLAR